MYRGKGNKDVWLDESWTSLLFPTVYVEGTERFVVVGV